MPTGDTFKMKSLSVFSKIFYDILCVLICQSKLDGMNLHLHKSNPIILVFSLKEIAGSRNVIAFRAEDIDS